MEASALLRGCLEGLIYNPEVHRGLAFGQGFLVYSGG